LGCLFFSSRRRHTRSKRDWSSDVCSSDLGINDGAAALVIASEERVKQLGAAEPLAAFVGSAVAGVDPRVMGIGPVPAVQKLLERDRKSVVQGRRGEDGHATRATRVVRCGA